MAAEEIPEALRYTQEHEWVSVEGDVAKVGITGYAAEQLGETVFAKVPEVGDQVQQGAVVGEVESHKSVSEIFSPVSGEVIAANDRLESEPELVGEDPYGEGWLFSVRITSPTDHLLDAGTYRGYVSSL